MTPVADPDILTTEERAAWVAYRDSLAPVRAILCDELLALPPRLRDHRREVLQDLKLSIQTLDRGVDLTASGFTVATLRLGTLLREAHIEWRGSVKEVDRRLKTSERHALLAAQRRVPRVRVPRYVPLDPVEKALRREIRWVEKQAAKGKAPWTTPAYADAWLAAFRAGERDYEAWAQRWPWEQWKVAK